MLSQELENLYLNTPDNILSIGYGYKIKNNTKTNIESIIFGVKEKKILSKLNPKEVIPQTIIIKDKTYVTDVVEIKKHSHVLSNCNEYEGSSSVAHRSFVRPLKGGISIGSYEPLVPYPDGASAGTLGGLVLDNDDGTICYLTNNHVVVADAFINSDKDPESDWIYNTKNRKVVQPGSLDSNNTTDVANFIGYIKRYYPLSLSNINYIDVALINGDMRFSNKNESFQFLELENSAPLNFANSTEIDSLVTNNIKLYKSGRSTGLNSNDSCPIIATELFYNTSVSGYLLQGLEVAIDFGNLIKCKYANSDIYPAGQGDSGSFVIGDFNGTYKIVGILFAGGSDNFLSEGDDFFLVCRIDLVSQLFNITSWNGYSWGFSNQDKWNYVSNSGLSPDLVLTIDNKKYWQIGTTFENNITNSLFVNYYDDSKPIVCMEYDKCGGRPLAYNSKLDCDSNLSSSTCEPQPDPPPPPPPNNPTNDNTVNFDNTADWNNQDGNLTTVGSNGPSSAFNTYDQNGNIWEWTDENDGSTNKILRGGSYDSSLSDLNKCYSLSIDKTSKNSNTGFRLSRIIGNTQDSDNNMLYMLSLQGGTANLTKYQIVINCLQIQADGTFLEVKRISSTDITTQSETTSITGPSNIRRSFDRKNRGSPYSFVVGDKGLVDDWKENIPAIDNPSRNNSIGIFTIGNLIYIIRQEEINPFITKAEKDAAYSTDFNIWEYGYLNYYIDTIDYTTGNLVGSYKIYSPSRQEWNTYGALKNHRFCQFQSVIDYDGFYVRLSFEGSNPTDKTRTFCVITIDASSGSVVQKDWFEVTYDLTNLLYKPLGKSDFSIFQKIDTRYIRYRMGRFKSFVGRIDDPIDSVDNPPGVGNPRDTYIVNKNGDLLSNNFFSMNKYLLNKGWSSSLPPPLTYFIPPNLICESEACDPVVLNSLSKNGYKEYGYWAYDGTNLYASVTIPTMDIFNLPGLLSYYRKTIGLIYFNPDTMQFDNTFPNNITWLKNNNDYNFVIAQPRGLSPDFSKLSKVRPFVFSNWSRVGYANNTPDDCEGDPIGSVDKAYFMQKYSMTNIEYATFLNSVAKTSDNYELWNQNMQDDPRGGIIRSENSNNYTYTVKPNMDHKPANFVSWFCAARFANWLHNKTIDYTTNVTETGAYTLNGAMEGDIPVNTDAIFRVPSNNEWYKAAYYDHNKNTVGGYWNYATRSDSSPIAVCANSTGDGELCS